MRLLPQVRQPDSEIENIQQLPARCMYMYNISLLFAETLQMNLVTRMRIYIDVCAKLRKRR